MSNGSDKDYGDGFSDNELSDNALVGDLAVELYKARMEVLKVAVDDDKYSISDVVAADVLSAVEALSTCAYHTAGVENRTGPNEFAQRKLYKCFSAILNDLSCAKKLLEETLGGEALEEDDNKTGANDNGEEKQQPAD